MMGHQSDKRRDEPNERKEGFWTKEFEVVEVEVVKRYHEVVSATRIRTRRQLWLHNSPQAVYWLVSICGFLWLLATVGGNDFLRSLFFLLDEIPQAIVFALGLLAFMVFVNTVWWILTLPKRRCPKCHRYEALIYTKHRIQIYSEPNMMSDKHQCKYCQHIHWRDWRIGGGAAPGSIGGC